MFGNHGLCGLLEEGGHEKFPECLGGNLGDFGEFCKGLYPSIKAFLADAGYRKTFKQEMQEWFGLPVDISEKISGSWQIIPKRWIVERSFAWLGWSRRLAKDFGWCPKKYAACFFSNLN